MDFTQRLMTHAFELIQNRRVAKVLQHPRVMQGVMGAMQLGAKMQTNWNASVKAMASAFNLATSAEVEEVRRDLRHLEQRLLEQTPKTAPRSEHASDGVAGRASADAARRPQHGEPEPRP